MASTVNKKPTKNWTVSAMLQHVLRNLWMNVGVWKPFSKTSQHKKLLWFLSRWIDLRKNMFYFLSASQTSVQMKGTHGISDKKGPDNVIITLKGNWPHPKTDTRMINGGYCFGAGSCVLLPPFWEQEWLCVILIIVFYFRCENILIFNYPENKFRTPDCAEFGIFAERNLTGTYKMENVLYRFWFLGHLSLPHHSWKI